MRVGADTRARLSGIEGAWARVGLGLVGDWAELAFSIFQGFSNCFSIYFL
jgi:hypothetical protein